jgi:uncharacterized membrane protein YgcG
MVTGSASVYLALALLFLFGSVAIAALLYAMLLAPYVRTTDRGTSRRGAGVEFLVTAAEMVLSLMIGSVLDVGGGGSGAASGPALSGGGGSFGGGGATGSW